MSIGEGMDLCVGNVPEGDAVRLEVIFDGVWEEWEANSMASMLSILCHFRGLFFTTSIVKQMLHCHRLGQAFQMQSLSPNGMIPPLQDGG